MEGKPFHRLVRESVFRKTTCGPLHRRPLRPEFMKPFKVVDAHTFVRGLGRNRSPSRLSVVSRLSTITDGTVKRQLGLSRC